jgi:hypothetical protein
MKTLTMLKTMTVFAAVGFGLAVVGCDSGTSCADGGVCDGGLGGSSGAGGAGGGGAALYGLTGGSYCYDIQTVSVVSDGCERGLATSVADVASLPLNYTAATATVILGKEGSLGQGAIASNMGTLLRDGTTADATVPTCTWRQKDTTAFTLTANNAFTTSTTETQDMFSAGCAAVFAPPGGTCTSTWTWTFKINPAGHMPDASGLCPKP